MIFINIRVEYHSSAWSENHGIYLRLSYNMSMCDDRVKQVMITLVTLVWVLVRLARCVSGSKCIYGQRRNRCSCTSILSACGQCSGKRGSERTPGHAIIRWRVKNTLSLSFSHCLALARASEVFDLLAYWRPGILTNLMMVKRRKSWITMESICFIVIGLSMVINFSKF